MFNQLRVEYYKLRTSVIFYLLLLLFAVLGGLNVVIKMLPLGLSGSQGFVAAADTSLMLILTLFVGYFVGGSFTSRTINNEVGIGYSRLSTILTKSIVVLPAVTLMHLVYIAFTILPLLIVNGLGSKFSGGDILVRLVVTVFQVMAIQSVAVLVIFSCRKSSSGIIVSVFFTFVTCNVLRNVFDENSALWRLTPFCRMMMNAGVLTTRDVWVSICSAVLMLIAVLFTAYIVFRKAELK